MGAVRRRRWARRGVRLLDDSIFPPRVDPTLTPKTTDYWRARLSTLGVETYCGVPMSKLPEDLRVYQHLMWHDGVDTVIEIGTRHGGSALWFRDTLATAARYGRILDFRVITVDIDLELSDSALANVDPEHEGIEILEGDAQDPGLPALVDELVPENAHCLVVDDSAHDYETTLSVLRGFAGFVPDGGFLVIEDGVVDDEELRVKSSDWPRGVLPAIRDWLKSAEGLQFEVRREMELYGVTTNLKGFLQRCQPVK